ncbi:thiolase family protein [Desulfomonile tiedjei]|uniref:Acetyl-CoA acetyltransferase n=1 Tax=Desulfomonile tiedjei (strain ATCC 49306 / DSM 6799 / DCB-1) TaxID=706587 RepID=I4C045_DESTA|nr:thiolase family protein [Desulfomonile tiedjei]AFM22936.1 acetyl-CoA acetyltransferase [Desulfomonile tiedjei DSM 6799]
MEEAYIVSAVRTPIGKRNGSLAQFRADELLGLVLKEVVDRVGVDPSHVEDVIGGVVTQVGEQGFTLPRMAVLAAGFPDDTPGVAINRQCGSGLTSINFGAAQVIAGWRDCVIACGCEIMSKYAIAAEWFNLTLANGQPAGMPIGPAYMKRTGGKWVDQGQAAELIAQKWEISKEEMDAFALRSHQRAHRAWTEGRFQREVMPVKVQDPDGKEKVFAQDETVRPETSLEALAGLKTVFGTKIITAGNSSPITDGASAVLIMSGSKAKELGVKPRARIVMAAVAGADPIMMLTGPIPATKKVLEKSGLKFDDLDEIEINEAFSPIPLAWGREYKPDWEKVNPNGGAIALGHPVGNSGCRLAVTCLHELERIQGRYGLITLCTGGGMAPATIIERV